LQLKTKQTNKKNNMIMITIIDYDYDYDYDPLISLQFLILHIYIIKVEK